jgi:uncharacterized metal-binding protein
MPMGRTHRAINTALCVPLTAGSIVLSHWSPLQALSCAAGYCFATFFMNPDLDLDSVGYQSWGPLRIIWWPYQKILAHRSYFSHFPVISTILRLIYLMWFPVLMLVLLGGSIQLVVRETIFDWWPIFGAYLLMFIMGMVISDAIHAILDVVSTSFKRRFSRHPHRHQTFSEHNKDRRHQKSRRK